MTNEQMTDEVILCKAVEKAVKNGMKGSDSLKRNIKNILGDRGWFNTYFLVIFSHDFAKAFWGEEEHYNVLATTGVAISQFAWEFHLQQMVLEPEPLKYLEKFL